MTHIRRSLLSGTLSRSVLAVNPCHEHAEIVLALRSWHKQVTFSDPHLTWNELQVAFLIYVSWTVPLRSCFGLDVEWPSVAFVMDGCVDLYFLLDFIGNFFTAYYDHNGMYACNCFMIPEMPV